MPGITTDLAKADHFETQKRAAQHAATVPFLQYGGYDFAVVRHLQTYVVKVFDRQSRQSRQSRRLSRGYLVR